jgi:hypothetical protein
MFKYEPPVDLTQEPWHTWEEYGERVYGKCRYCNAPYYQTEDDASDEPHRVWCKWWIAYCDAVYTNEDYSNEPSNDGKE